MSTPTPQRDSTRDSAVRRAFNWPPPRDLARYILVTVAAIVIVALIVATGSALTPFFIGLALAYLLEPIVNRLDKRMPRWAAILVAYAIGLIGLVVLILFLVPPLVNEIIQLIANLTVTEMVPNFIRRVLAWYEQSVPPELQAPFEQLLQRVLPQIQANLSAIAASVGGFVLRQLTQVFNVLAFLIGFLIVPIWLFYVLRDARRMRAFVNRLLDYRIRRDFWNAWGIIDHSLHAYLRGQLTLSVIVGVSAWIGLIVLDFIPGIEVDYIVLLAIWSGISELVPMIGATLAAIPALIVTLVVGGPGSAAAVLALYVTIQLIENNILVPRVIGASINVHPAILIVALVVFGQLFGLLGVILAAPITAMARDLYLYAYSRLRGKSPSEAMSHLRHIAEQRHEQHAEAKAM